MTSVRLFAAALLAPIAFLCACSRQADLSLVGHWQAERLSVYSAKLPVGPDIVVQEDRISNPETGVDLPIKGIERKGDEATVDFDYGIGVTFYFDSPNRLHIDVPLIGKVFYRRISDSQLAATAIRPSAAAAASASSLAQSASPAANTATVRAVSQMEEVPASAVQQEPSEIYSGRVSTVTQPAREDQVTGSDSDYQMALNAARAGQQDQALDFLNVAFRDGFRDFGRLDAAPELDTLKADVRYQALVNRYR
jgi:hypothetical protein